MPLLRFNLVCDSIEAEPGPCILNLLHSEKHYESLGLMTLWFSTPTSPHPAHTCSSVTQRWRVAGAMNRAEESPAQVSLLSCCLLAPRTGANPLATLSSESAFVKCVGPWQGLNGHMSKHLKMEPGMWKGLKHGVGTLTYCNCHHCCFALENQCSQAWRKTCVGA